MAYGCCVAFKGGKPQVGLAGLEPCHGRLGCPHPGRHLGLGEAELLYLDSTAPGKDVYLYINSPGGLAYAGMAIYDTMQLLTSEVSTVCVGMGMSAAAMVLCGGAPGKRLATPNAKIMIHQGSAGARGAPRDMEVQLREVLATTRRMAEIVSHHSGKPLDQVERDIDRDFFMTAEEAKAYGLIDEVLKPQRGVSAQPLAGALARAS